MGRFVGITVVAVAALMLSSCGSSTTTVVNNTTAVAADTTTEATDDTTTVEDGFCGDVAVGGFGAHDVVATAVDCDDALAVAKKWDNGDCYESSSSACDVDPFTCIRRFGDTGAIVFCTENPAGDERVEFTFGDAVPGE